MSLMSNSMFVLAQGESTAAKAAQVVSAAPEPSGGLAGWMVLLIVLAVLVLPFVIGQLIANALKLKDLSFKIGITLFSLTLGLAPFVSAMAEGRSWKDAISLGIDLAGGSNMVFQVDHEGAKELEKIVNAELMERMKGAVERRVNPSGTEEVSVRVVGRDRIEVIVPGADPERVARIKKQITQLGSLEFGLLANQFEHPELIREAQALPESANEMYRGQSLIAKWRPVATIRGTDPPEDKEVGEEYGVVTRSVQRDGKPQRQFLVVVDPDPKRRITGRYLKRASEEMGNTGAPVVGFEFNTRGGYLFQQLTARHMPKEGAGYKTRLAILLNEEIHSAPSINDMIGDRGIIEGDFDQAEIDELINVLNAGALEVPLIQQPISEFTISPLLGIDVQERGLSAIKWATIAVFVVTLAYYLFPGFVACLCLALNMILLMGTMSLIDATFTLPGLAGIALTIGMAVDANVLIFERMREEINKGSSVRMAIHNGFSKALSAIVDSNVTTLITAVVLYVIGSDQVKGFAVTLFIGLVMNMFTAVFVGRLIFDIVERKRWLKSIRMLSAINAQNINFLGSKWAAMAASLVLIGGGMIAFAARGSNNLDIDFLGGAMVTFRFEKDSHPGVDDVRAALQAKFGPSITLEKLLVDDPAGGQDELFRLRTVEREPEKISRMINEAFSAAPYDQFRLVRQHVESGEAQAIADATGTATSAAPTQAEYAGGHEATVTVSEPIIASSLAQSFADALGTVKDADGTQKYQDASALVTAEPLEAGAGPTSKVTQFVVRSRRVVDPADVARALVEMKTHMESQPLFEEKNTFDASVASDTRIDALMAIIISNLAIIAYLWFRFQRVTFGLAAVVALAHDVLCVLVLLAIGAYLSGTSIGNLLALEDFKINLSIVAAFLTLIGYSLNDKIVVFDRIREVRGKNPALTDAMVNRSLNETLSRTLLTASTTLIVLLILYFRGGEGVHGFAYCMFLGIVIGTYSSIYIASPVLLWLMNRNGGGRQLRAA
jgi:SecD/SecF fusion protein